MYLNRQKNKYSAIEENKLLNIDSTKTEEKTEEKQIAQVDEAKDNVRMGFGAFWNVFKKIWLLCGCLSSVYYFEYAIFTSFTDRTIHRLHFDNKPDFLHQHLFEILLFTYQCGVVCSRSSLKLIKVPQVWIFFIFQALAYSFWLTEVITANNGHPMIKDAWAMVATLFMVGIIGGGCYVNVMYCLISHEKLQFYEKELAVNICTIMDDFGVICASVTALIMSNFIYPN